MENGKWRMESGELEMENWKWRMEMENGELKHKHKIMVSLNTLKLNG